MPFRLFWSRAQPSYGPFVYDSLSFPPGYRSVSISRGRPTHEMSPSHPITRVWALGLDLMLEPVDTLSACWIVISAKRFGETACRVAQPYNGFNVI